MSDIIQEYQEVRSIMRSMEAEMLNMTSSCKTLEEGSAILESWPRLEEYKAMDKRFQELSHLYFLYMAHLSRLECYGPILTGIIEFPGKFGTWIAEAYSNFREVFTF